MLAHSFMPLSFRDEAFYATFYTMNRFSTPIITMYSSIKVTFGIKLDYQMLKTFRCQCFPCLRPYNNHKFDFKSKLSTSIGYSHIHKSYECRILFGKVVISRHVIFNENNFPMVHKKMS